MTAGFFFLLFFKSSIPLQLFREEVRPISYVSVSFGSCLSTFEETDKYSSTLSALRFDQSQDCPHFHSAVTSLIVSASPQAFISKIYSKTSCKKKMIASRLKVVNAA